MGVGQTSVAAATAVVGYDLANGTNWQNQSKHRALTGFAIKGSAAAGDTKVDLLIDTVKVGEFYNISTGFPNMDDLIPMDNLFIPAGAQVHVLVTDAPATNPINIMFVWEDV